MSKSTATKKTTIKQQIAALPAHLQYGAKQNLKVYKKFCRMLIMLSKPTRFDSGILFSGLAQLDKTTRDAVADINTIFTHLIINKKPEFKKYFPYKVRVKPLVAKNEWSSGMYIAINKPDGTLDLHLNFEKFKTLPKFPLLSLTWAIAHEFRHKIQKRDKCLQALLYYPNWSNFRTWAAKKHKVSTDLVDHIFHELNPEEVDANTFASELTGFYFMGNAFDITPESLKKLTPETQKTIKRKVKLEGK